jgi:hypothetical protein
VVKKSLFTAVFLSILLSTTCGTQLVKITKANPVYTEIFNEPPVITIKSPLNNKTYPDNVLMVFNLTKSDGWFAERSARTIMMNRVVHVNITLDEKLYRSIKVSSYLSSAFNSSLNLANLEDGLHSVQIHAACEGFAITGFGGLDFSQRQTFYSASSNIVNFTVDGTPPVIEFIPFENKTYGVTDIPLNFTLNEATSQMTYSLDGQANMTITGNATLTGLAGGGHNVTLYATDVVGNTGVSETVFFNVEEPTKPFPTTLVIAPVASMAVLGVGLAVYFKKRKR